MRILAGTAGGMFVSNDGGGSWSAGQQRLHRCVGRAPTPHLLRPGHGQQGVDGDVEAERLRRRRTPAPSAGTRAATPRGPACPPRAPPASASTPTATSTSPPSTTWAACGAYERRHVVDADRQPDRHQLPRLAASSTAWPTTSGSAATTAAPALACSRATARPSPHPTAQLPLTFVEGIGVAASNTQVVWPPVSPRRQPPRSCGSRPTAAPTGRRRRPTCRRRPTSARTRAPSPSIPPTHARALPVAERDVPHHRRRHLGGEQPRPERLADRGADDDARHGQPRRRRHAGRRHLPLHRRRRALDGADHRRQGGARARRRQRQALRRHAEPDCHLARRRDLDDGGQHRHHQRVRRGAVEHDGHVRGQRHDAEPIERRRRHLGRERRADRLGANPRRSRSIRPTR